MSLLLFPAAASYQCVLFTMFCPWLTTLFCTICSTNGSFFTPPRQNRIIYYTYYFFKNFNPMLQHIKIMLVKNLGGQKVKFHLVLKERLGDAVAGNTQIGIICVRKQMLIIFTGKRYCSNIQGRLEGGLHHRQRRQLKQLHLSHLAFAGQMVGPKLGKALSGMLEKTFLLDKYVRRKISGIHVFVLYTKYYSTCTMLILFLQLFSSAFQTSTASKNV